MHRGLFLWLLLVVSPGSVFAQFVLGDATVIGSFTSTVDTDTYTTASVTPLSGQLVLAAVHSAMSVGTDTIPTLSGTNGWNVTWTQVATVDYRTSGNERRVTLFRGVPSSGTAGTLTTAFSATQVGRTLSVISWANVDQTTNQGVVQSATACAGGDCTGGTTATSLSVTLAAFGNANNATYGVFGVTGFDEDQVPGTGFTELQDMVRELPTERTQTQWRVDNDTSVDQSSATTTIRGGIAVELDYLEAVAAPRLRSLIGVGL